MDSEDSQTMMEFEIQAVNRLDRIVLAAERQAAALERIAETLKSFCTWTLDIQTADGFQSWSAEVKEGPA